jgi:hypothetical protein
VEHAPVKQSKSEEMRQAGQRLKEERIEPELVATTTQQGRYAPIHNTKATPGEELPSGLIRSKFGFLLKVDPIKATVDLEKVKKEMALLERVAVIAYFVGGNQPLKTLQDWLKELGAEVGEELQVGRDLGQGFFQIMCKGEASAQKVLVRTPHHSRWGTSILQPWCLGFNPRKPEKMRMPVWVTLKDVPGEFRSSAMEIVESLGPVLGKNRSNVHQNDQKFCVALTAGDPFPITVEVINPVNSRPSLIAVDYNNLPIRCRHCLATTHLVKDCPVLKGRGTGTEGETTGDEGTSHKNAGGRHEAGTEGASTETESTEEWG